METKPNQYVFVYSTMRLASIREEVIGHDVATHSATLVNYNRVTVHLPDDDYPNVVQSPRGRVAGQLLEVTGRELADLDDWENEYRRIRVHPENLEVADHVPPRVTYMYILREDAGGYTAAHSSRDEHDAVHASRDRAERDGSVY